MLRHKILFLAANPLGQSPLKLDEEARGIEEELRRARGRDQFEFVPRLAARPLDLLRALREVKPSVLHFAGQAGNDGITLVNDSGQPVPIGREALHATIGAAGHMVQIVMLVACATEELARALCELVPMCVGTAAAIPDAASRAFSLGFYGGLADGEPAERAFRQGKAAMHLEATGGADLPRLYQRRDIDPQALVLVGPPPTGAAAAAAAASSTTPTASAGSPSAGPRVTAAYEPGGKTRSADADHARAKQGSFAARVPAGAAPDGTDVIDPLVLLQLSDLHFGPHSRFADVNPARLAEQCRQAIDEARGDLGWSEPVGLVIGTGDIAEAARPREYASATAFFTALTSQLGLRARRLVLVPGNHDISWTKCREVEGQLEDGAFPAAELRARLDAAKLVHFNAFIRDVHGGRTREDVDGAAVTALGRAAFVHDFAELGVSIAALNSCERESHRTGDHVGWLSREQAQAVLDHWRGAPAERIRIVAVHHNPATAASVVVQDWLAYLRSPAAAAAVTPELVERLASDFAGFEGRDALHSLASDAYVSIVLHGHHHASTSGQAWSWRGRDGGGDGTTRILSAGSWGLVAGKLPRDQPVAMQLVRIDPTAAQIRAVLLTWDPNARLPGGVEPGRFQLDAASRSERPVGLSLPAAARGCFRAVVTEDATGAAPVAAGSARSPAAGELRACLARYRTRKQSAFERWDLRNAGPTPTSDGRPVEIKLDEMYLPLRFDGRFDPDTLDRGAPINPEDLLASRRPQVVVGPAGAGKTTWMRWTFRRLIGDPRAVPFFLELRKIAVGWTTAAAEARSIESYLAEELDGCGAPDTAALVQALLADTTAPRPVMLLDGWDELGGQGERLRERLIELCRAHPHVVVLVSSRPYAETRPAGAEAFETVYIQPLANPDIHLLATLFHRRVHDELACTRATDEFLAALAEAPGARSLAGTALLLTMMLLLSREGPLPDRRHKLYTACVRSMLLYRVTQRERDGVVVDEDLLWRPDDSEERLRVVAELAYRMQSEGYRRRRRAPIVRTWEDAVHLLPDGWPGDQRERFLRWLIAAAGLLVDRTDRSVQFAHLSFQEHLAAYYLFISREGDMRVEAVRSHMRDHDWWETLRLWAGLVGDQWPDKLTPVLDALHADPDAYWLAGQMYADGAGRDSDFSAWLTELPAKLSNLLVDGNSCARAWRGCKQGPRREQLTWTLSGAQAELHWLAGVAHASWCELAKLDVEPAPALRALAAPMHSGPAVGRSRALHGVSAMWPDRDKLALLRLWSSDRAIVSARLQTAISVGAARPHVAHLLLPLIEMGSSARTFTEPRKDFVRDILRSIPGRFYREANDNVGADFLRDLSRDVAADLFRHFGQDLARGSSLEFAQYSIVYSTQYTADNFADYFVRGFVRDIVVTFYQITIQVFVQGFAKDFVRHLGKDLGRRLGLNPGRDIGREMRLSEFQGSWIWDFVLLEISSVVGRAAIRSAFAHARTFDSSNPLLRLFRAACRASLEPASAELRAVTADECKRFDGDPLWPALARHVSRMSTPEDRALLIDLAAHPEKREPPLSWGLQHYVRGDLVLADDSIVTLDELCAEAGVPPLPLLGDMPDEIDVQLEATSDEPSDATDAR